MAPPGFCTSIRLTMAEALPVQGAATPGPVSPSSLLAFYLLPLL